MKTRSPFLQSRTNEQTGPIVYSDAGHFPGNVWFVQSVHSNAGDSAGKGQTPDAPFATLGYAISQCTASNGDVIFVLPGHAETITGAAGVALNVAGVTVVGTGKGRLRGKFTFTTAVGASFDVSGANCHVEGLVFINGIDSQTAMVNVTAADVTIRD